MIDFYAEKESNSCYILNEDSKDRLRIFARTGGDGSIAAFWLDDFGYQKIVHIGSGSGSMLAYVLGHDPLDFLRLLAIGYDEICWNDDFNISAADSFIKNDFRVKPNLKFQNWLVHEFNTSIPNTASEIVKYPAEFGDENSPDSFCSWVNKQGENGVF